ncbi:MAG: hypothetical protein IJK51_04935 [Bacteroidaceae bacterium]|nr:hypothetical protein [Bacteroidaceae bacterium]
MKKSLLIVSFLMACISAMKAETVLVGDGTTDTKGSGLPSAVNWKYCVSQQIYTVAEINHSGNITDIAFKSLGGPTQSREFEIYLTTVQESSFDDAQDWNPFSQSDLVFSGEASFTKGEWTTITFDTPFYYYGTKNLCVTVIDKTGSFIPNTAIDWLVYPAEKQSLHVYNDNKPYTQETMNFSQKGNFKTCKNQIQLTFDDDNPNTVTIGLNDDGDFSTLVPIFQYSNYSMSEQIYRSEEIGRSGVITSIAFYNVGNTTGRNIDIYLKNTYQDGFFSTSPNWIKFTFAERNKVFSGYVSFTQDRWTTITLDKPFYYNDEKNLAVIVDDNTSEGSSIACKSYFTFSKRAAYIYSGITDFNPARPPKEMNTSSYNSCIQLGFKDSPIEPDAEPVIVKIGSNERKDAEMPTCTKYNNSISEQIYTKKEIGRSGLITGISFYNEAVVDQSRLWGIFLVPTDNTAFNSNEDLILASADDIVFASEVFFKWDDWTSIQFQEPFYYDGSQNLAVIINDSTGISERYELQFRVFEGEPNCSAYLSSNDASLYPNNVRSYGLHRAGYKNCIRFHIIPDPGSALDLDFINFETGDLSQFSFQNDSEYPWIVTDETAAEGKYCMRSGNAEVSSSSSAISATRTYDEDGIICFDAKCMGEGSGWDKCVFYIDGEQQFSYGALGRGWAFFYFPVQAGTHTFKWEYTKDSSVNPDGDAFFVDNIQFLQGNEAEEMITGVESLKDDKDFKDSKHIYNLAGMRLNKMQRGINIVNGRKVLVK